MERVEKAAVKEIEYMMKLLEKEWNRSGRTTAVVSILVEEIRAVNSRLADAILKNTEYLEMEHDFKENLAATRENYVLLRVVRKVIKAEERAEKKKIGKAFSVEFDKEEYKLFKEIVGTWEE